VTLPVDTLTPEAVAPFGWLLGKPYPEAANAVAFTNAATDFRREHLFHPGEGGEVEVLWVSYRNADPTVDTPLISTRLSLVPQFSLRSVQSSVLLPAMSGTIRA